MQLQTKSWCVEICRVFRMRGGAERRQGLVQCSLRWQKLFAVLFSQQLPLGAETDILPLSERSRYEVGGQGLARNILGGRRGLGYSWKIIVGAAGRTPCLVCLLAGKPLGRPSPYADFAFTTLDSNFDLCPRNLKPETRSP